MKGVTRWLQELRFPVSLSREVICIAYVAYYLVDCLLISLLFEVALLAQRVPTYVRNA